VSEPFYSTKLTTTPFIQLMLLTLILMNSALVLSGLYPTIRWNTVLMCAPEILSAYTRRDKNGG
jgi:hypothetical protein